MKKAFFRTSALACAFAGASALGLAAVASAEAPAKTYQATQFSIKHAAAIVEIVAEDRADLSVAIEGGAKLPPLEVKLEGDRLVLDGKLANKIRKCNSYNGKHEIGVSGLGDLSKDELPKILIRAPKNLRFAASGAVFTSASDAASLEGAFAGCGDAKIGKIAGSAKVSISGSSDVWVDSSGPAAVAISGSGDARFGEVAGGFDAKISGSGDIKVDSVSGDVNAAIAGSGDIGVQSGDVKAVRARIAGSGDIRIGGSAASLDASIAGSGDIRVARVTGSVNKRVAGSGDVIVGQ